MWVSTASIQISVDQVFIGDFYQVIKLIISAPDKPYTLIYVHDVIIVPSNIVIYRKLIAHLVQVWVSDWRVYDKLHANEEDTVLITCINTIIMESLLYRLSVLSVQVSHFTI